MIIKLCDLKFLFLVIGFFMLPTGCIFAQLTPRVVHFDKEQYGAHSQNWMIAQSSDGKMYFGNTEGLLQYDGLKWELFQMPHQQPVRSVACDSLGNIFTGAFGELGYWKINKQGRLIYHSLLSESIRSVAEKEEFWNILQYKDAIIFQSFSSILIYDYHGVRLLEPPGNIMFAFEVNGALLLQVIGNGVYRFTPSGNFELLPSTRILADKKVISILPFSKTSFLVATANDGLYLWDSGRFYPWQNEAQKDFKEFQMNKGIRLANGQFAFGTILNGLYVLDAKGRVAIHINQKVALQNNTVLALCEDNSHNLWVGMDKGIDLITLNAPLKFFIDKDGVEGTVYTACKYEGNLYLGTNQGLFAKPWQVLDDFGGVQDFEIIDGSQGQVWDLEVFDGQLLCGHNEGSFLVNGAIEKISKINGGFSIIQYPDSPDTLIQGTYTGFVIFAKDQNGKWAFSHRINGFIKPVKTLFFDNEGYLWAANPTKGLYRIRLSPDLQSFTEVMTFSAQDGLPDDYNIDIMSFNGQLFFMSAGRYYFFEKSSAQFKPYNQFPFDENGVKVRQFAPNKFIKIYKDHVTFFDSGTKRELHLSLVHNYEKVVEIDSNNYLFCLDNGFAVYNDTISQKGGKLPLPVINRIAVLNHEERELFPDSFPPGMEFPPESRSFRFHYFQPVFDHQPQLSYQLTGYDSIWYATKGQLFKEFTNLPAGDYVFKLRSDEDESLMDAFAFSIREKWYKQPWMMGVYLLVFWGVVWLFYRMHLNRLKKVRKTLAAKQERILREQEIKSKNEKLSLELINKSKELANSTMGLIYKNEILLKIKEELLKIRKRGDTHIYGKDFQKMLHLINVHITSEKDWEIFETNFNQVHEHFFKKLKAEYPTLTPGDLQLAAYLKMNLSSKEIAPLLNISLRGVENKRYRLRKKLGLPPEINLIDFMMKY